MKRDDQNRPYDPKKSVWIPTESHDFKEGLLESDDGIKAVVQVGHEVSHGVIIIIIYNSSFRTGVRKKSHGVCQIFINLRLLMKIPQNSL